jgi:lysozyme
MNIIPENRPRITEADVRKILAQAGITDAVAAIGFRGYYRTTMGDPTQNDRGIYDDAIVVVSPDAFATFNANTDPSIFRPRVASLKLGVWRYKPGQHGITFKRAGYPYPAFVQAAPVTVIRDGVGADTGWFGINIHRGSNTGTSSLGCQTIPPAQWAMFRDFLNGQLQRHGQKTFPYVLR